MTTAMENIKEMVDVNTIVGEPVETPDGSIIIPVSRVGFGFAAGGSEFKGLEPPDPPQGKEGPGKKGGDTPDFPFGGGSGGGVSITPVGFLVVSKTGIRMLNMEGSTHLFDRLLDLAPGVMEKLQKWTKDEMKSSQEPKTDI